MKLNVKTGCPADGSCQETRTLCMGLLRNHTDLLWVEKAAILFFLSYPDATLLDFIAASTDPVEAIHIAHGLVEREIITPDPGDMERVKLVTGALQMIYQELR